jgi:class 3 adenylate cyclase
MPDDLSAPEAHQAPDRGAAAPTERVADADRDRTVTLLREHVAEGRLTLDEFSDRVGRALQATTRGELEAVMIDLPAATSTSTTSLPDPATSTRKSRRWHVAIMSGHETKGRWRISGKTNALAIMGGCDMDLRRAEIEGPEVEITAVAFWGGIKVVVPEGFDVELRGFSFMGGRSLRLRDVPIIPGSPRIVVRGFAVMGGIEVQSRSSKSGRIRSRSRARHRTLDEASYGSLGSPAAPLPPLAVPGVPPVTIPPADPFDLAALGRDIRREIRKQRRRGPGTRVVTPPPTPPSTPPAAPAAAPTAPPPAHASSPSSPASPASPSDPEPFPTDGTVTILFCDMVDYAGMTERLGDQVSRDLLRDHHRIVREALSRHGGREIKVQGDGFMLAFGGAARALRCAVDIQRAVAGYIPPAAGERIAVHIGIHTGDAVDEGDDYLGLTVIVASRLADAAGPGEILVSSLSEQLVQGSGEFTFDGYGDTPLKGMTRPQPSALLLWKE